MAIRKVYVTKRVTFEAAHHLEKYDGKCSRIHGHSYKLEVTFSGSIDPLGITSDTPATEAMVCDFSYLKILLEEITTLYDHSYLNNFFSQPTAECMAINIFEYLKQRIGKSNYEVHSVKLWETEDSYAEYKGELI